MQDPQDTEVPISNVVRFPKIHPDFNGDLPTTIEEASQRLVETKMYYIEEAKEMVMDATMSTLQAFGYLLDGRRVSTNDIMLLELAIEGIMCRYTGLEHGIHEISDSITEVVDEPEDEQDNLDDVPDHEGDHFPDE